MKNWRFIKSQIFKMKYKIWENVSFCFRVWNPSASHCRNLRFAFVLISFSAVGWLGSLFALKKYSCSDCKCFHKNKCLPLGLRLENCALFSPLCTIKEKNLKS